jgi:ABC-type uncharacterized transport system permease subunit
MFGTILTSIRGYGATAAMAAGGFVGESRLFLIDYVLRFARVAVLLALWRIILAGQGEVSGMTLGAVLTYSLLAEIFSQPLSGRTEIIWALWQGDVATRFLQPTSIFGQFTAEAIGRWLVGLALFSLPLWLAAPLLGVNRWPASATAGATFAVSLPLGVAVALAVEFIFSGLVIALQQGIYAVDRVRVALTALLSGAVLPLALLPWGLGSVFDWLPFAAIASAPLRVYTGTGDPLRLVLLQAFWAIALWLFARWIWQINREQLSGYGG